MQTEKVKIKERPILFSGQMVRAILEDQKTQTRRVCKIDVYDPKVVVHAHFEDGTEACIDSQASYKKLLSFCPYGKPGDRLWVRETFTIEDGGTQYLTDIPKDGTPYLDVFENPYDKTEITNREVPHYLATEPDCHIVPWACMEGDCDHKDKEACNERTKWCPSIYMPRWASRIDLEVVSIRVEKLNKIDEEDAIAEGSIYWANQPVNKKTIEITKCMPSYAEDCFKALWDQVNGIGAWEKNPWVWVVEFKRIRP